MTKYLNVDQHAVAACLSPVELAKDSQDFYIYNPASLRYVSVTSSSPVMKEQESKLVETDSDIRGHGKNFKLHPCDDGMYNIVTLSEDGEENGFLYLSEKIHTGVLHRCSNILQSNVIIQGHEKQYMFEITENKSQWGLYKIHCNGKMLYASKGAHTYLLADHKDLENSEDAWFQFNLKTRIVKREETGEERRYDMPIKDSIDDSFVYSNNSSKAVNVKFNRKDKKFFNIEESTEDDDLANMEQYFIPTNPILVEANSKLTLQLLAQLTAYIKLKKVMFETEDGKTFLGFAEQKYFHNRRGWKF